MNNIRRQRTFKRAGLAVVLLGFALLGLTPGIGRELQHLLGPTFSDPPLVEPDPHISPPHLVMAPEAPDYTSSALPLAPAHPEAIAQIPQADHQFADTHIADTHTDRVGQLPGHGNVWFGSVSHGGFTPLPRAETVAAVTPSVRNTLLPPAADDQPGNSSGEHSNGHQPSNEPSAGSPSSHKPAMGTAAAEAAAEGAAADHQRDSTTDDASHGKGKPGPHRDESTGESPPTLLVATPTADELHSPTQTDRPDAEHKSHTAVPESPALLLALSGIAALCLHRRRSRLSL